MSSTDAEPPGMIAVGLVLFGILDLAAGVLYLAKAVIFALLSVPGLVHLPARYGGEEIAVTAAAAFPPAVFFLALGFGSVAARRWARSFSLAFSALWLGAGAIAAAFLLAFLPGALAALRTAPAAAVASPILSPEVRAYAVAVLGAVVLPGAYVLFYRSAGVRAECERRDPEERWTDRVPLSVLATAILLAGGALLAFDVAFAPSRQILLFGHRLEPAGRAAAAAAALVEAVVAWRLCRLDRRAGIAAAAIVAARGILDVGVCLRAARRGLPALARLSPAITPETRAAIERLEPLHPLAVAAAGVAVLSAAGLALALVAAGRLRRA